MVVAVFAELLGDLTIRCSAVAQEAFRREETIPITATALPKSAHTPAGQIRWYEKRPAHSAQGVFWSEWRDLNSRPLDPQSSALPTAPHPDIAVAFATASGIIPQPLLKCKHKIAYFLIFLFCRPEAKRPPRSIPPLNAPPERFRFSRRAPFPLKTAAFIHGSAVRLLQRDASQAGADPEDMELRKRMAGGAFAPAHSGWSQGSVDPSEDLLIQRQAACATPPAAPAIRRIPDQPGSDPDNSSHRWARGLIIPTPSPLAGVRHPFTLRSAVWKRILRTELSRSPHF